MERKFIFFSYSNQDRDWLERLQKTIKPLLFQEKFVLWDNAQIQTGNKWRKKIQEELDQTLVAVFLVSMDFLNSDFIAENVLPPLLEKAEQMGMHILWFPIGHSNYEKTPIAEYQAAWEPSSPLETLSVADQNYALADIARKVKKAAESATSISTALAELKIREKSLLGQLEEIRLKKEQRVIAGKDTAELDREIKTVNRELEAVGRILSGRRRRNREGEKTGHNSPDNTILEIIRHQMEPVNQERLSLLGDALRKADGDILPLEEIVDALTLPLTKRIVASAKRLMLFNKGLSRWFSEPAELKRKINVTVFAESSERFLTEIKRSLPGIPEEEVVRRYYLAVSAMLGSLMRLDQFVDMRPEKLNEPVIWEMVKEMKEFICAGLGRPRPKIERSEIILDQGSGQRVVDTRSICSIRADDNYTRVCYWGGGNFYVRKTMKKWEHLLSSDMFIRIHRGAIINRSHISEIEKQTDKRLRIQLNGENDPHFVSRRRAPKVKELLNL